MEEYLLQALQTAERAFGPTHPNAAIAIADLAKHLANANQKDPHPDVEPLRRRHVAIIEKNLGPESLQFAAALSMHAQALEHLKRYEEAVPMMFRSLGLHEKLLGKEHIKTMAVGLTLSMWIDEIEENNIPHAFDLQKLYDDFVEQS